jgi:hypothetical protein
MVPSNPAERLRRDALSVALTSAGFPVSTGNLATMAANGSGPPFMKFGRIPLYRWSDALAWAEARLTAPRRNTAEAQSSEQQSSIINA